MIIILAKAEKTELEEELDLLGKIKKELKKDPVILELLEEYGRDLEFIDNVPIDLSSDIDVSAKTINARILLNKSLLNEPFDVLLRYAAHELVHVLQHIEMKNTVDDPYKHHDYLDRPDELEAFQVQIEFDKNRRGDDAVVEYVEDLLDYHDIPEKEKPEKREELMEG